MTKARFSIEDGRYGPQLVLQSSWSEEVVQVMEAHGIRELYLNEEKGFRDKDVSFLSQVPDLEVLWIVHHTIQDISPIHVLHGLRSLKANTYCKTEIDFTQFPKLEHCYLEWRPRARSLFQCATLQDLWINRYQGKETDPFAALSNLVSLSLANAPVQSLTGLARLNELRFLGLYRLLKLPSLHGIEGLERLEALELNACRAIGSIEEIRGLANLRRLHLIDLGPIKSLEVLERLPALEEVLFYQSTDILDGNLNPLRNLPNLKKTSFQNRRHYTHRREDFEQYPG